MNKQKIGFYALLISLTLFSIVLLANVNAAIGFVAGIGGFWVVLGTLACISFAVAMVLLYNVDVTEKEGKATIRINKE